MDTAPGKSQFFKDLDELRQQLTEEGALVESRLAQVMRGLDTRDVELLDDVAVSDGEINARQMAIDDRAFSCSPCSSLSPRTCGSSWPPSRSIRAGAGRRPRGEHRGIGAAVSSHHRSAEQALLARMSDVAQTMFPGSAGGLRFGYLGTAQRFWSAMMLWTACVRRRFAAWSM